MKSRHDIRVLIVSQGANAIVRTIIEKRFSVVGIVESAPRYYDSGALFSSARRRFLVTSLLYPTSSLRLLSWMKNIPYFLFHKSNSDSLGRFVKKLEPDVIVVYSMSRLLKEEVFSIPKYGTLNLHSALLPAYRGAAPRFWVYYNMEPEYGVTLHYIDSGEDTGNIVEQDSLAMPQGLPHKEYEQNLLDIGCTLIVEALRRLDEGKPLPNRTQFHESPTCRARRLKKTDFETIIDWCEFGVDRVWHIFRGTPNWQLFLRRPGRFLDKFKIWTLRSFHLYGEDQEPKPAGLLEKVSRGRYLLHCIDGCIIIETQFSVAMLLRVSVVTLLRTLLRT